MSSRVEWTPEMLHALKTLRAAGASIKTCAKRIGVSHTLVGAKAHEIGVGGWSSQHRLRPEEVREIRAELAAGFNANEIARKHGLARRTIGDIRDGITWKNLATVAAVVAFTSAAYASPPPVGSNDWEIMMPYKEWIEHQHLAGGEWCCDWGDGRPVDAEQRSDGFWWAHVTPEHYPGVEDHWIRIPPGKVHKGHNPVGIAILWYSVVADYAYCFAPSSEG